MLGVSWGLGLETSVVNTGELGRSQGVLSCDAVAAKAPIAPERALGWKGLQSGPKLRQAGWAFACPTWTRRCAWVALGPDSSLTKVSPVEGMMLACAHGSIDEGPLVQSDVKCILQWQGTHLAPLTCRTGRAIPGLCVHSRSPQLVPRI